MKGLHDTSHFPLTKDQTARHSSIDIQMAVRSKLLSLLRISIHLEMKSAIEAGSTLSVTAINSKIFTPLVIQMIAVGEETGRIDELLLEVSDFYDREVDYDLKTLTARIEPLLLVIVAGMVMVLALGIFLPMWGMLDIIKGG